MATLSKGPEQLGKLSVTQYGNHYQKVNPKTISQTYNSTARNKSGERLSNSPLSDASQDDLPPELPKTTWELPPKPRPGRKAATDIPTDKRKASNRNAQRAFRDRKKKKLQEVQAQLEDVIRTREDDKRAAEEREAQLTRLVITLQRRQSQPAQEAVSAAAPANTALLSPAQETSNPAPSAVKFPSVPPLPRLPSMTIQSMPSAANAISHASSDSHNSTATSQYQTARLPPLSSIVTRTSSYGFPSAPSASISADGHEGGHKVNQSRVTSTSAGMPHQNNSAPWTPTSPPSSDPMEIDFTDWGNARSNLTTEPQEDPCGFCGEGTYCVCKEDRRLAPGSFDVSETRAQPVEPNFRPSGPGSCSACMSDPLRRKMCMDIASQRNSSLGTLEPTRTSGSSNARSQENAMLKSGTVDGRDVLALKHEPSSNFQRRGRGEYPDGWVSCNDAITMATTALPNLPNETIYDSWVQGLKTVPHQHGPTCSGDCNETQGYAQDIEIASILHQMRGTDRVDGSKRQRTE